MVDTGTALVVLGISGPIIAAIIKFAPSKSTPPPPPTNGNRAVTQSECEARMETTGTRIAAVGEKVDTLHGFTKAGFERIENAVSKLDDKK